MIWRVGLTQDLRVGWRRLLRAPGFMGVGVVSIAIGVGCNTVLFMVTRAMLTPRSDDAHGMLVDIRPTGSDERPSGFPYQTFRELALATDSVFVTIAGSARMTFDVTDENGKKNSLQGQLVLGSYFGIFGVRARYGRVFHPLKEDDSRPEAAVILSHRYWRRAFAADPGAIGRTIRLNGYPHRIAGVAEPMIVGLFDHSTSDLWVRGSPSSRGVPGAAHHSFPLRGESFVVKARLADGVTLNQAQAVVDGFAEASSASPGSGGFYREIRITPAMVVIVPAPLHPIFHHVRTLVLVAAILPLLVACLNLAGFLLARAERRGSEAAVLFALGASRSRMIRSHMVHTTLLTVLGGGLGLFLSTLPVRLVEEARRWPRIPLASDLHLDLPAVSFALGTSLLAGVVLGSMPALGRTRSDSVLGAGGPRIGGPRRTSPLRSLVVSGQVAGTLALLVAGGLFLRSYSALQRIDPGFEYHPGAIAWIRSERHWNTDEGDTLVDIYLDRLAAHPDVVAAGLANTLPLEGDLWNPDTVLAGAATPHHRPRSREIHSILTAGDYFNAMGIPLVAGRTFDERERRNPNHTAIVNRAAAALLWPGADAVGQTFQTSDGAEIEVVGVVGDVRMQLSPLAPEPFVYRRFRQVTHIEIPRVVARTRGDPGTVLAAMRQLTEELDFKLTILDDKTMDEYLSSVRVPALLPAGMVTSTGILALLLAAVGLYGMVSYMVAARIRELGIRVSVGASPRALFWQALRAALKPVVAGLALGLVLASVLAHGIRGYLHGVGPFDLATFGLATAVVAAVSVVSAYLSARQAGRIDPVQALKAG